MDAFTVTLEQTGEVPDVYVGQLAYSPDGKTWAVGSQRTIGIYQGLEKIREFEGWLGTLDTLTFSADGKQILIGHTIYDSATGKKLYSANAEEVTQHTERGWAFDSARVSLDGTQILGWLSFHPSRCCRDRDPGGPYFKPPSPIYVVQVSDGKAIPLDLGDKRGLEFRALAVNDRYFVVGGIGDHIYIFDRHTLARIATIDADGAFQSLTFSADGSTLLGVKQGHELWIFDTATWKKRASWDVLPDSQWVDSIAVNPKLPVVALAGWDEQLQLYSFAPGDEGRLLTKLKLSRSSAMAFSPTGDELLVALNGYKNTRIVRFAVKSAHAKP